MPQMSRDEHLAWCKKRALEYLDHGDLKNAVASMGSDLNKHEDFRKPAYQHLTLVGIFAIQRGPAEVRKWIEGFN